MLACRTSREQISVILQLKIQYFRFEFPSAPPARNLICAMELLFALGAIDEAGNLTKPLGRVLDLFHCDFRYHENTDSDT